MEIATTTTTRISTTTTTNPKIRYMPLMQPNDKRKSHFARRDGFSSTVTIGWTGVLISFFSSKIWSNKIHPGCNRYYKYNQNLIWVSNSISLMYKKNQTFLLYFIVYWWPITWLIERHAKRVSFLASAAVSWFVVIFAPENSINCSSESFTHHHNETLSLHCTRILRWIDGRCVCVCVYNQFKTYQAVQYKLPYRDMHIKRCLFTYSNNCQVCRSQFRSWSWYSGCHT